MAGSEKEVLQAGMDEEEVHDTGSQRTRYRVAGGTQDCTGNLKLHTRVLGRRRLTRSGVEVHDTRTTIPPHTHHQHVKYRTGATDPQARLPEP